MKKILLGLTGSVATVLYEKLVKELQKVGDVSIVLTEKAEHFVPDTFDGVKVYRERQEWRWPRFGDEDRYSDKWQKDDNILHISLRDKYSAFVIAPCSANTLAKLANGMCDNLLTSVARAWDRNRPLIIAPAMNTHMWDHPITEEHLKKFQTFSDNNWVIYPQKKMLACKTEGMGALAEISTITDVVYNSLKWTFPMVMRWGTDQKGCQGIPVGNHPGAFAVKRKNSTHTGVDLYANIDEQVFPVEDGTVVAIEPFTGPKDNSPWWLDTDCVLVEGASGVVCYGEIRPNHMLRVGRKVIRARTVIGTVLPVIPEDAPQHPELPGWKPSMLHMELYPHGYYKPSDGYGHSFDYLQDPTPYLIDSTGAPTTLFKI
jgi:phosphopantothenoylcysteine decarboxylase